jgi:hypothetical protein
MRPGTRGENAAAHRSAANPFHAEDGTPIFQWLKTNR